MPDVKHVGGFGPLLDVFTIAADYGVEVSPNNPAGPVATAASLHCAALRSNVSCLELAFDPDCTRSKYGEIIQNGLMTLGQAPGWGVSPECEIENAPSRHIDRGRYTSGGGLWPSFNLKRAPS